MWRSRNTLIIHKGGICRDISYVKKQFLFGGGMEAENRKKYGFARGTAPTLRWRRAKRTGNQEGAKREKVARSK